MAAATPDAIKNMIAYVNKLNASDKTALVYALGLAKYMPGYATASLEEAPMEEIPALPSEELVVAPKAPTEIKVDPAPMPVCDTSSPVLNDLVPTEEVEAPIAEETNEVAAGPMIGIYSIPVLCEKVQNIVKSHQFNTDAESEMAVVDTLVTGISSLTIEELAQTACDKLCIECPAMSDLETLKDFLDTKADEINSACGLPTTLIFIVKGDDLVLAVCFTKQNVAQMMETYMTAATAAHGGTQAPISLSVKKEVEALAGMKSLSGIKAREIRNKAPRMAQYIACIVADFRTGKTCAWSMASSLKRNMRDLVESCYGKDAGMYYDHLKGIKE